MECLKFQIQDLVQVKMKLLQIVKPLAHARDDVT